MLLKLDGYEYYIRDKGLSENTQKNYFIILRDLDDWLEKNEVTDINKGVMLDYKDHLLKKEYKPGKKYRPGTVNVKINVINKYFKWQNNNDNLTNKQVTIQNKGYREFISESDYQRLLKHANDEGRLFMLVVANTGLRIAEVKSLKKSDLKGNLTEVDNKGTIRVIALPDFIKKELKQSDMVKNKSKDDFIFSKSTTTYWNYLKNAAGKARVKKERVFAHSFRHYFAKSFMNNGGSISDLSQMLGHKDIRTTMVYLEKNVSEIAELFKKQRNTQKRF